VVSQETMKLLLQSVRDSVTDDIYLWILKDFKRKLPENEALSLTEFLKKEIKDISKQIGEDKPRRKHKQEEENEANDE